MTPIGNNTIACSSFTLITQCRKKRKKEASIEIGIKINTHRWYQYNVSLMGWISLPINLKKIEK
jgi:hypothetical protein